ncbi:MAG: Stp1/IreP family PP2C-type Ser/Thr phosphatase [Blastocatellia bacterium]|nr:Stp1/IreP family PP2C-type Ser/Thr phosphatase [Blastocatellia bacterium]
MSEDVGFKVSVYVQTDLGMVRSGNEDNFLVLNLSTADTWTLEAVKGDPSENLTSFVQTRYGLLLAVTDGMGGALAGEVASRLAVECVRDRMIELQSSPDHSSLPFQERLRLSIELANLYIYQMSMKRPEYAGMGATFTAVGFYKDNVYFAQVGDSRAYLIRDGHVQQMTRDQSLVGQLVQAGHITEEEAERHTYKNVILQALGAASHLSVAVDRLTLRDMDIMILCSDGLSNKVRAEEMKQIIDRAPTLKDACESLIQIANQRGGEDNITVLVTQCAGGHLKSIEPRASVGTLPLSSGSYPMDRWGVETIPRPADLPDPNNLDELGDKEETTLRPTDRLDN